MVGSRSFVIIGLCLMALSAVASANGGSRSLKSGCPKNCSWCEHGKCVGCNKGYKFEHYRCDNCDHGYYKDGHSCVMCGKCSDYCNSCDCGKCTSCKHGYILQNHKCISCPGCVPNCAVCKCGKCIKCEDGYEFDGHKCVKKCYGCGHIPHCGKCDCNTCTGCKHGYHWQNNQCKNAHIQIHASGHGQKVHISKKTQNHCQGHKGCSVGVGVSVVASSGDR